MNRPLLVALLLASAGAAAQPSTVAYAELLGNGGLASLNAERRLDADLALRVGVGFMPARTSLGFLDVSDGAVSVPVMLVVQPSGGTGLELGTGAVVRRRVRSAAFAPVLLTATVGYRRTQPNGDVFRVGVTSFAVVGGEGATVYPWLGVSFGTGL